MEVTISIVVPVKNGIDTLPKFINGIKNQTLFNECEVIIMDSSSTDGSINYLQQFNFIKIVHIEPSTFNHGGTRNLGTTYCSGKFVLFTVQDAWTTDPLLLEKMIKHFDDKDVMGVCGQQIVPHIKGTNPHEWFRPYSTPEPRYIQFLPIGSFNKLSSKEQFLNSRWDDVIAMYRRSALEQINFEEVDFGEDMLWAKNALNKGFKLVWDSNNRVCHYHHAHPEYVYKRTFIVLYFIYKTFGYIRDLRIPKKNYIKIIYRNFKYKTHVKWILFNWKALKAVDKAAKDFLVYLKENPDEIDIIYKKVCSTVPQGKSK